MFDLILNFDYLNFKMAYKCECGYQFQSGFREDSHTWFCTQEGPLNHVLFPPFGLLPRLPNIGREKYFLFFRNFLSLQTKTGSQDFLTLGPNVRKLSTGSTYLQGVRTPDSSLYV